MPPGEQGKRGIVGGGGELLRRHLSPFKMKRVVANSRLANVLGALLIAASILLLGSQVRYDRILYELFQRQEQVFTITNTTDGKPVRS